MHVLTVMALCCLVAQPAPAQGTAPAAAAAADAAANDDAAVRAVVARYVDAREKRDAKLLEAL